MSDAIAYYKDAMAKFAEGDHSAAIEAFEQAITADPALGLAYQGLSEVYARSDQLDQAIVTIQRAIELEPEESLYRTSLSRFLQRQGRIPEAEAAAAEAARLQSS